MTEGTDIHRGIGEAGRSRQPAALPAGQYHWRMALPDGWVLAGSRGLGPESVRGHRPVAAVSVYEDQLRFSALTLTAIFAVYSVAVLVTLLVFGSVSDYLGRRPVIVAALAFNMGGCALFLRRTASVCWSPPRLQGVAVGAGDRGARSGHD